MTAVTTLPGAVAGDYQHPTPSTDIVGAMVDRVPGGTINLTQSYELCRQINAAHGRTYYFATRLLPAHKRPHVHALYAFARYADDLVDHLSLDWVAATRREALEGWSADFLADLARGHTDDPVCQAVIHTVQSLQIDHDDLRAFLSSMAMDLTVTRYETFQDLYDYVYGSAAVIGSMMLPVLQPLSPAARGPAIDLGVAFQLTNFIRDIGEDLERGRIYLPMEDLRRFGVTEADLARRQVTPAIRRLVGFEIARTRALYRRATAGWTLLPPASARCIRVAHRLYEGILDAVEDADYQVFRTRAVVGGARKAITALEEFFIPLPTPVPVAGATRVDPPRLYGRDGDAHDWLTSPQP